MIKRFHKNFECWKVDNDLIVLVFMGINIHEDKLDFPSTPFCEFF